MTARPLAAGKAPAAAWLLCAALSCAWAQERERAPFITTPPDVVERMLRFAAVGPEDVVVDLGSGDGRIVLDAARKFGARGVGIELDAALVQKSRELIRQANLAERVSIVQGDVLQADISAASVVTVYLLPSLISRLQPRFIGELKPGTRIVAHAFYMPGWKADRTERMRIAQRHQGQGDESILYLWVVPADVRGLWEGGEPGGWRLRVQQNFQEIDVEAWRQGNALPVSRATLSGTRIALEGPDFSFTGRVEANLIRGELLQDGRRAPLVLDRKG